MDIWRCQKEMLFLQRKYHIVKKLAKLRHEKDIIHIFIPSTDRNGICTDK